MSKERLNSILEGKSLTLEESRDLMDSIMTGEMSPPMTAALLVALRAKGETAPEVAGMAQAMQSHAVQLSLNDPDAVDGCGTGGDGTHTFNISTAAALVTAAAGVTVAKHGNRSVSSSCGSADLLEQTGGCIDPDPKAVRDQINRIGFGFMFAPNFHPAMKYAGPIRRELGIRTVFNILGPLTNPARVRRQVIGVYDRSLLPLMAEVGRLNDLKHLIVAHSQDGLDEFSVTARTDFVDMVDGQIQPSSIGPEEVGLALHPEGSLKGGGPKENYKLLRAIFDRERSPYRDAVLFNAGAMIYVSGKATSIKEGVGLAGEAVDNRSADKKLDQWITESSGGAVDRT
ncbi:MAG: anthranilate phosphoribosyltransferase [bacterium]|nr:anthranilate phosphoribosyltransferase [bacterium]